MLPEKLYRIAGNMRRANTPEKDETSTKKFNELEKKHIFLGVWRSMRVYTTFYSVDPDNDNNKITNEKSSRTLSSYLFISIDDGEECNWSY